MLWASSQWKRINRIRPRHRSLVERPFQGRRCSIWFDSIRGSTSYCASIHGWRSLVHAGSSRGVVYRSIRRARVGRTLWWNQCRWPKKRFVVEDLNSSAAGTARTASSWSDERESQIVQPAGQRHLRSIWVNGWGNIVRRLCLDKTWERSGEFDSQRELPICPSVAISSLTVSSGKDMCSWREKRWIFVEGSNSVRMESS